MRAEVRVAKGATHFESASHLLPNRHLKRLAFV